jgi:hypothetical protein
MLMSAHQLIRQRVGVPTMDEANIAQLATISEMKGLWQAMLDRNLITEAQRQDYLDRGARELLTQIESKAAQIYVEGHG